MSTELAAQIPPNLTQYELRLQTCPPQTRLTRQITRQENN